MWPKNYRDYPADSPLIKEPREPNRGIVGCEMHEINGWGNSLHIPAKGSEKGVIRVLLDSIERFFNGRKKAGKR